MNPADKNGLDIPDSRAGEYGLPPHGSAVCSRRGKRKPLLCLGIETSCDETALALYRGNSDNSAAPDRPGRIDQIERIKDRGDRGDRGPERESLPETLPGTLPGTFPGTLPGTLLGEALSSQAELHALFGGVVPELASREHYRRIGKLYDLLLKRTGVSGDRIDLVAVARGPGLLGALLVGIAFAKGLCLGSGAKLIGVNHLEAHLLACGLERPLIFPALGLLVSGGHTHIYRIDSPQKFRLLGRTLDDAAGEAFDKVAKLLRLPYPGGKWLDALGQRGEVSPRLFPKPYLDNDNLDFSFSGLKTAAGTYIAKHPELPLPEFGAMDEKEKNPALTGFAASFNHSVAATLAAKLRRALLRENENFAFPEPAAGNDAQHRQDMAGAQVSDGGTGKPKAIILAGGVAANSFVRRHIAELAQEFNLPLLLPSPALCTDNAAMIAHAGWLLGREGLRHDLRLGAIPKGRAVPDDYLRS